MGDSLVPAYDFSLGSFSCPRRTDKYDTHFATPHYS
jgi:hypothetical protein